jgi:hypothetical protein
MNLSHRRAALLLVSLSIVAGGCLGEVAPQRVVAGTTFVFPFSGNISMMVTAPSLYGITDPNQALGPDRQRGNADFVLCANPEPNCGTQRMLTTRYITRVTPDRGSKFGRSGASGQDLVVVDVPFDTPPGTYQLAYSYRVVGASADTRVTLQPITVVRGFMPNTNPPVAFTEPDFTDITKAFNFPGQDLSPSLRDTVPDPQVELALATTLREMDVPAAGKLTLTHPDTVTIEGVFEAGVLGQGSLVRMTSVNSTTTTIQFVDPDRRTSALRVAFSLKDNEAPVTAGQFKVELAKQFLYTRDGALIPRTQDPNAPVGNGFMDPMKIF